MGKVLSCLFIAGYLLLAVSCSHGPSAQEIAAHQGDVASWYSHRVEDLRSRNGWLNLAGLFWLEEGMNSFGSDSTNDVVFPRGKIGPKEGYFFVKGQQVIMTPAVGSHLKETVLFHPDSTKTIKVAYDPLEWFVIRRGDKFGIRLRDLDSDNVKNFSGIERFPVDYSWKIKAMFLPAKNGETIDITNMLGQTTPTPLAGKYQFEIDGKQYALEATGDEEKLFVVFGDATNGKETYEAGRFIYVEKPDSTGSAFIDFNKSYNPPCVFTEFATCPVPRKENILPIGILAGEKKYESHGK